MSDADEKQKEQADKMIGKKPFIEPEMKEFDDLEKQISGFLIGTGCGMKFKIAESMHHIKDRSKQEELAETEALARTRIGTTTAKCQGPQIQFQFP